MSCVYGATPLLYVSNVIFFLSYIKKKKRSSERSSSGVLCCTAQPPCLLWVGFLCRQDLPRMAPSSSRLTFYQFSNPTEKRKPLSLHGFSQKNSCHSSRASSEPSPPPEPVPGASGLLLTMTALMLLLLLSHGKWKRPRLHKLAQGHRTTNDEAGAHAFNCLTLLTSATSDFPAAIPQIAGIRQSLCRTTVSEHQLRSRLLYEYDLIFITISPVRKLKLREVN